MEEISEALAFFEELFPVVSPERGGISLAYVRMNDVFRRVVDRLTEGNRIRFAGPFAKVDYLIKEYGIDPRQGRSLHATRDRLRHWREYPEEQLARFCLYDLKSVCEFISLLYGRAPIPPALSCLFPVDVPPVVGRRLLGERLSVLVQRWDESFVYATEEASGDALQVACEEEWRYLFGLLEEGVRLNLVRPRLEEGIVYPELIIYEPDYLVDISAVANCFESYAHSAQLHLLNKIKSVPPTPAILLGNFAGQLLDETVHHSEHSYADSMREFFRQNAVGMTVCQSQLTSAFHEEARLQQQHIRRAMLELLPREVKGFKADRLMLEPSFFSELLGLQGRMDLLQLDYNLLIEQKAGKGAWGSTTDTPRHQLKHYVQLLLYMALLHYNYGKENAQIYAFLLYSKYENSLLKLGPAPTLLHEAIRVRNEIVHRERTYARGVGLQELESMEIDSLNELHASGKLWEQWIRPQLMQLLAPIRSASPLERTYYFRFFAFLEAEHFLAKVGERAKENAGFASKWYNTLEEKRQCGDIYDNMALDPPVRSEGGAISTLVLRYEGDESEMDVSNFRLGDIVVLYAYPAGSEPDVRQTMVFRASIVRLEGDEIELQLRSPQNDARVFERPATARWAIEHDFFESSFSALYKGLHAFLSASQGRRDLLLGQRSPKLDTSIGLKGDYGRFNELVLRAKQARDLFLIIGPPGTGKTSFGLLNILQEELQEEGHSILLLSYTNRAVDEICSKLVESGIDFLRVGSRLSCAPEYTDYLLGERAGKCQRLAEVQQLIQRTNVFCATTSALNGSIGLLSLKRFDLAIVDEASQILEPYILGLLSARGEEGRESIARFILIGDHKQLPAVVQQSEADSKIEDPLLLDADIRDCRQSLFERLLRRYREDPSLTYMLTRQGRMHREIAAFPSEVFYGKALQVVPLEHQEEDLPSVGRGENGLDDLLATRRVAFVAAPFPVDSSPEKVNLVEAEMIAATVWRVYLRDPEGFDSNKTVGVIVPYRNQIAAVRNALGNYGIEPLTAISIDTVERYQGSQRDVIIYGFTIRKRYQLNFLTEQVFEEDGAFIDRKLNVAMTRARRHLVLIGNPQLLQRNVIFSRLIAYTKERGCYLEMEPERYCKGDFKLL